MHWVHEAKEKQFYRNSNREEVSRKDMGNHTVYSSKLYLDEFCADFTVL